MLNLHGDLEGRCNGILRKCKHCETKFSAGQTKCSECGEPREYCSNKPEKGKTRCKFHGGRALAGIDHPNYQGKGLSKNLPTRMLEQYLLAIDDPDILNMSEDIALLKARRNDLLGKIDETPSYEMWRDVQKTYLKFRNETSPQKISKLLSELDRLIVKGQINAGIWKEIYDIEERLRRLSTTERERRKEAEQLITENQFRTMVGYIINAINVRVKDEDQRMALLGDIQRLGS